MLRSIADYGRFGPSLLALVFGLLAWPAVVASVEPAPNGGFGRGDFWTSPAMLLAGISVSAMVTPLMLSGTTRKSPRTGGIATLAVAWTIAVTTHALLAVIPDAILYGDPQADALSTLVVDVLAGFLLGPYLAIGAFAALSVGVAVWTAVLSPAGARIRAAGGCNGIRSPCWRSQVVGTSAGASTVTIRAAPAARRASRVTRVASRSAATATYSAS